MVMNLTAPNSGSWCCARGGVLPLVQRRARPRTARHPSPRGARSSRGEFAAPLPPAFGAARPSSATTASGLDSPFGRNPYRIPPLADAYAMRVRPVVKASLGLDLCPGPGDTPPPPPPDSSAHHGPRVVVLGAALGYLCLYFRAVRCRWPLCMRVSVSVAERLLLDAVRVGVGG